LGPVWAIKRDPIWREERKNNKEKKERWWWEEDFRDNFMLYWVEIINYSVKLFVGQYPRFVTQY
jgi:hypothetical protein